MLASADWLQTAPPAPPDTAGKITYLDAEAFPLGPPGPPSAACQPSRRCSRRLLRQASLIHLPCLLVSTIRDLIFRRSLRPASRRQAPTTLSPLGMRTGMRGSCTTTLGSCPVCQLCDSAAQAQRTLLAATAQRRPCRPPQRQTPRRSCRQRGLLAQKHRAGTARAMLLQG